MFSQHGQQNQENYKKDATSHDKLSLDSTLYLAYRDVPALLQQHLLGSDIKKLKVLDFGCGAGLSTELLSKMLADTGCETEIIGIDLSCQNIDFARQRVRNAKFYNVAANDSLNFLGTFDLIICNFVLVENPEQKMDSILKLIYSLLNENGVVLVTNCSSKAYKKANQWYTFNNNFDENEPKLGNGKVKFEEDQSIKVQVFTSSKRNLSFTFYDFFHSGSAYKRSYEKAGFEISETYKPIGKPSDGICWKDELRMSPYKIHILKKQNAPSIKQEINPRP